MIIWIPKEAQIWNSIAIVIEDGHQSDIFGGFGCNENSCAKMENNIIVRKFSDDGSGQEKTFQAI